MTPTGDRRAIFAERLKQAATAKYKKSIVTRLAEDMDVSIQATSKWLRGDTLPREDAWGVIAGKLNVSVQWLTGATHEIPEHLADVPDEALSTASAAARIVFPLITRLKPEADQETFDDLFRHAYMELKSGRSEREVAGEVASRLI